MAAAALALIATLAATDFVPDQPPGDALRFPPRAWLNEGIAFNYAFRRHLRDRLEAEPDRRAVYESVLAEAEALWRAWDACRDAQSEYLDEAVRRDALRRLAGMIGRDAYWRGELPPPVPYWRFRELR